MKILYLFVSSILLIFFVTLTHHAHAVNIKRPTIAKKLPPKKRVNSRSQRTRVLRTNHKIRTKMYQDGCDAKELFVLSEMYNDYAMDCYNNPTKFDCGSARYLRGVIDLTCNPL